MKDAWLGYGFDGSTENLISGLGTCKDWLRAWSTRKFGLVPRRVWDAQQRVAMLQDGERTVDNINATRKAKRELDRVLYLEEYDWQQRS